MSTPVTPLPSHRHRLAQVLRNTRDVIAIDAVASTLDLEHTAAAKLLSRWAGQGWLRRIGRGLYVPVPLALSDSVQVIDDPWILAPTLFGECYVGGWTAAHHWDLTEQLFNKISIFTRRRVSAKTATVQGVTFLLHHISNTRLFGLERIWRNSVRVSISDPARTLIDMLSIPSTGGGIDHVADCLSNYAKSPKYDGDLLIQYGERLGNGAVFKRLGFLAESQLKDSTLASACRARMTQGYAQLDPDLVAPHLHTAWRLWVPERWRHSDS